MAGLETQEALGPPPGVTGYRVLSLLEPPRPRRIARSPRADLLVVATVCVGAFMGQLDASIVTVALPRMAVGLHAGVNAVEWVSLSYVLTLVALVVPVGSWSDSVGRKSLYVGGFVVFTIASGACAAAPDLLLLCLCRIVQATGAALMQANSVALIAAATPRERLGRMVGLQAAAQAVGLAAGPVLGGALLGAGSWRWLFLVNLPAGTLGITTAATMLPRSRDLVRRRRISAGSLLRFVPAVGSTLLALSLCAGGSRSRAAGGVVAVAAVVAACLFVRHERVAAAPLVSRSVRRAPRLVRGLLAASVGYAVLFGTMVALPLHLSRMGESPTSTGLVLAALPIGIGVAAPAGGYLADRAPRLVARGGLGLAVLGVLAIALLRPVGSPLAVSLAGVGLGLGAFTPANNRAVMLAAPRGSSGAAAGLLNMMRGLGTAGGTAFAVIAFGAAGGGAGLTAAELTLVVLGLAGLAAL